MGSKKASFTRAMILIAVCLLCLGYRPIDPKKTFTAEDFSFYVNEGELVLKGTLTIPNNFRKTDKVVILVSPPLPISRDYSGLFSSLAEGLSRQGIAVLRYDNRSYVDSTWADREKATMFNQAEDASLALLALKRDKRFSQSKIGLIGHSEGGASVAITASQHKLTSFIVQLSTMGTNGLELAHHQMTTKIKKTFLAMNEGEFTDFSNDLYKYLEILAQNENIDSIKQKIDELIRVQYPSDPKKFGTMSLDASIKAFQNLYLKPRLIRYVQFRPEKYYSYIDCPAFIICGSDDERVDCDVNLKGIEKIFKKNNKKNYKLEIIEGMDHSLRKSNVLNNDAPTHPAHPRHTQENSDLLPHSEDLLFKELCLKVANWIKEV